jgi:hypothetical protein
MAFSKTPEKNTYQTKHISLMKEQDSRSQNQNVDIDNVNCFFEPTKNKVTQQQDVSVMKRAGTSAFGTALPSDIRGFFYWEDQNKIYIAYDNDIRVLNADTGTTHTTLNNVFVSTSGDVGFTEFLYDDNTVKVVATDGTRIITIDNVNTVVTGADVDMPVHLPYPIFLDGYLFLIKTGTADIYNSDLNDPLAYTPGNFISCEMFADKVVRIAKLNNYIVCFGTNSVEYFWDAANATGSPLQRNDTPVKLNGYLGGFAQNGNKIYFLGNTAAGSPAVYELEDFKIEERSTPSIRKFLEVLNVGATNIYGSVVGFLGHDFYVLNVRTALTYVMDTELYTWTRWAFQNTLTFDILHAVNVKITTEYTSVCLLGTDNSLYRFNTAVYRDNNVDFTMRIVTGREMFETYNQKRLHRLVLNADRTTANSNINISWSDDDYQTYNTAQAINLNQDLPSLHRLGNFRRRAFKLEYTDNFPLRIKGLELEVNMGQH